MLECSFQNWAPQIGDPSLMGWITVLAYLLSSGLSALVAISSDKYFDAHLQKKQCVFWFSISIILFFLCINKQLDLQTFFTATGKCVALKDGWYDMRKTIQVAFMGVLLSVAVLCSILLILIMRKTLYDNWLALLGILFLLVFVLARASSFHHIDTLISFTTMNIKMNWALELTGIFLISISAISIQRRC